MFTSIIRFLVLHILLLCAFITKGQMEKLEVIGAIDFSLPTQSIITQLKANKSLRLLHTDSVETEFPCISFIFNEGDTVEVCFLRDHFSCLAIFSKDRCLFDHLKTFSYENFKITKRSVNHKKQRFLGKQYNVTLLETNGINEPKYNFWICSRKYQVKI